MSAQLGSPDTIIRIQLSAHWEIIARLGQHARREELTRVGPERRGDRNRHLGEWRPTNPSPRRDRPELINTLWPRPIRLPYRRARHEDRRGERPVQEGPIRGRDRQALGQGPIGLRERLLQLESREALGPRETPRRRPLLLWPMILPVRGLRRVQDPNIRAPGLRVNTIGLLRYRPVLLREGYVGRREQGRRRPIADRPHDIGPNGLRPIALANRGLYRVQQLHIRPDRRRINDRWSNWQ